MKKTIITLVKLAATAAIMLFIINKLGLRKIISTIAEAQVKWLLGGVVIFGLSALLGVAQWRVLLQTKGIDLAFGRACKLYFMGMFFNNFVFGFAAGDAVRVTYIKLGKESGKAGIAATFLDRFAGLWAMMGFAFAGSLFLLNRGLIEGKVLSTAFLSLFGTFILFCGILSFLISRRLQKIMLNLINRLPIPKKELVLTLVRQTIIETRHRGHIARVAALSLLIQFMRIGVHVLCGVSLGLLSAANFHYFFIFVPILAILMIIPLPFGAKEGIGGTLFALAGFQGEAALVMEFLASIVGILVSSIGGVLFLANGFIPQKKDSNDEIINRSSAL
ncbi:MAG: hypothetical protein GF350_12880 [Chitinivibrionales bacterium]|nr:hypothetical protein [Chitinivibrionales bacterium]